VRCLLGRINRYIGCLKSYSKFYHRESVGGVARCRDPPTTQPGFSRAGWPTLTHTPEHRLPHSPHQTDPRRRAGAVACQSVRAVVSPPPAVPEAAARPRARAPSHRRRKPPLSGDAPRYRASVCGVDDTAMSGGPMLGIEQVRTSGFRTAGLPERHGDRAVRIPLVGPLMGV